MSADAGGLFMGVFLFGMFLVGLLTDEGVDFVLWASGRKESVSLLKYAKKEKGIVFPLLAKIHNADVSKRKWKKLVKQGVCIPDADDRGRSFYRFPDFEEDYQC